MVALPITQQVQAFLGREHRLLIGDRWQSAQAGRRLEVIDPATEAIIAHVQAGQAADVDLAVAAARASFDDGRWWRLAADERAKVLWRFGELIEQSAEQLAQIEVLDNGMPLAFAEWEIATCAHWLRYFAGKTPRPYGVNASDAVSSPGMEFHAYTTVEPIGVAGLILPWNAPAGTLMIKLAPALAAGCSCVVKPAENTPLIALRLAELALEAGLPPGVLNVVTGYGHDAGHALAAHPLVDKISFTGSTAVGRKIIAAAAGNLKRLTLELGGKSPVIVFDDADIESCIPKVAMGIFANTGQVCFAGSRLYVQKKLFDRVVGGVADFAKSMKIGSGLDRANLLGPLISASQKDRVAGYIERGLGAGAELITGGKTHGNAGFFIEPTVFANVDANADLVRQEVFGPVLVATAIDDLDDLISVANDTRYGLGAGIYTRDVSKAHRVARRLQAGNVWVNCYGSVNPAMPFGGYKESGWGRELGEQGLAAFTETKSTFIQLT